MSDETRKSENAQAEVTPRSQQTDKVKDLDQPEVTERDAQTVKGGISSVKGGVDF